MIDLKRILVPTDLSEHSLSALDYAGLFAERFGARVFLLHVAETASPTEIAPESQGHPSAAGMQSEHEGMRLLQSFTERRAFPGLSCTPVVRAGVPAEEIRRFADEERIDMVVMATHGRTGLHHILMGSVAETVVRHSGVPVLTIKPSQLRESVIRNEDIENELHLR